MVGRQALNVAGQSSGIDHIRTIASDTVGQVRKDDYERLTRSKSLPVESVRLGLCTAVHL